MAHPHTPGPWPLETVRTAVGLCHKIGRFPSRGVRNTTYACVYEDGMANWRLLENGALDSELLANARLIAAAPDLLAALKECSFRLATLIAASGDFTDVNAKALDTANVVLAQAEGRS